MECGLATYLHTKSNYLFVELALYWVTDKTKNNNLVRNLCIYQLIVCVYSHEEIADSGTYVGASKAQANVRTRF